MNFLAIGAAVLAFLVWLGRGGKAPKSSSGAWRIAGGLTSLVVLAGATFVMLRGGYAKGLGLLAVGLVLALGARWPRPLLRRPAPPPPPVGRSRMSPAEARAMLGVDETAGRDAIEAAYKRLMKRAHPDQGGSSGLAAQLNAARETLLK